VKTNSDWRSAESAVALRDHAASIAGGRACDEGSIISGSMMEGGRGHMWHKKAFDTTAEQIEAALGKGRWAAKAKITVII